MEYILLVNSILFLYMMYTHNKDTNAKKDVLREILKDQNQMHVEMFLNDKFRIERFASYIIGFMFALNLSGFLSSVM